MRLIRTDDGMYGWVDTYTSQVRWFTNPEKLKMYGVIYWDFNDKELESFCKEVDYALSLMSQNRDSAAEFGVLGTFMYTHDDV